MENSLQARLVYETRQDNARYGSHESLEKALLIAPDTISGVITNLAGREDKKFPLTFMTQGQKHVKTIELNSTEYMWDVLGMRRKSDVIHSHAYSPSDRIGQNQSPIYIIMKTDLIIDQHYVTTRNGVKMRVSGMPKKVAGGFMYTLFLMEGTSNSFVPASELTPGFRIAMSGGAPVALTLSRGNYSNRIAPGKMKNQISLLRKSYEIAGNYANKRINIQLQTGDKTVNNYMSFEKWLHMMDWMQECEEHLWYSKYNRQADGTIIHRDQVTGKPIPVGAGVLDQIPNWDSYGKLSLNRLSNLITDIFYGATDQDANDIILYTGQGGMREFDRAIKESAGQFTLVAGAGGVGQKFVTGQDGSWELKYGAYFNTYRHIDGHTITVKLNNIFDYGGQAEAAPRHRETGLPLTSYMMVFVDHSMYEGEPNIYMTHEKGRSMRTGVLRGFADTDYDFDGNAVIDLATDEDKSSVHFLKTAGVAIRRSNHCFVLECDFGE